MSHLKSIEGECAKIIIQQTIIELTFCPIKHSSNTKEIELPKIPIEQRFAHQKYAANCIFYRKTGELYDSAVNRLKFDKLNGDKNYLTYLLDNTLSELKIRKQFDKLEAAVKNEIKINDGEKQFLEEFYQNKCILNELKLQRQKLYSINFEKINKEEQLDEINFDHAIKIRFIRNWEKTRQEQQQLLCEKIENNFMDKIQNFEKNIDTENQSHDGMRMYLIQNLDQMREECEIWKDKYEHDYEQVELDIHVAQDELDEFCKYDEEMKLLYQQRQEKMEAFLKYKRDKEGETMRIAKIAKTVIYIQAWWRGVMVRKKLGPYRKKGRGRRRGRGRGKGRGGGRKRGR